MRRRLEPAICFRCPHPECGYSAVYYGVYLVPLHCPDCWRYRLRDDSESVQVIEHPDGSSIFDMD
jgi:hypothetical protein